MLAVVSDGEPSSRSGHRPSSFGRFADRLVEGVTVAGQDGAGIQLAQDRERLSGPGVVSVEHGRQGLRTVVPDSGMLGHQRIAGEDRAGTGQIEGRMARRVSWGGYGDRVSGQVQRGGAWQGAG